MTEEAAAAPITKPPQGVRAVLPSALRDWPHTEAVFWSVCFFLLTFSVYWYLGPQNTPYNNHVSQANSLIHGHLDQVPEYSGFITEPALYNGESFCLPPEGYGPVTGVGINLPRDPDCKFYLQHPPGPALIVLPGVLVFGLELNQTLVSVVLAALTAPVIYAIVRSQVSGRRSQLALTTLFLFGTTFWWVASNGGVWFLSHTAATLFLFLAIYTTLVRKNLFLTGAFLGAAFLCRNPIALSAPFFLIMFSDRWLHWSSDRPLLQRVDVRPLLDMAAGALPFIVFSFTFNYLRFDNPLESGYTHSEQLHQDFLQPIYNHGVTHPSYIQRHPPVLFEAMPVFSNSGSYVWPSWAGQAIWATTPAFFYALFVNLRNRWIIYGGIAALAAAVFIIISRKAFGVWFDWTDWASEDFNPGWRVLPGIHLFPFYGMIALAIAAAVRARDKLVIACWIAILCVAFPILTFAATGWSQFGYRYAIDFYPFLFLLTVRGVGSNLRWHHAALILLSILINAWAVLWIYQFEPARTFDWTWVSF